MDLVSFTYGMMAMALPIAIYSLYQIFWVVPKMEKEHQKWAADLQTKQEALQKLEDSLNEMPSWDKIHNQAKELLEATQ